LFTLRDNQRKSHDRADKFREKHVGADAGGRFVREWFLCRRVQFYRAIFHLSADCASSVGVLPASALHALYSAIVRAEYPQIGSNFVPSILCVVLALWLVVKLRTRKPGSGEINTP